MPGTHLLPPNLLKLFAPRPPLPYTRPLDRDIDRVRNKNVDGVGKLLARLREDKTQGMLSTGEGEAMEEGEDPGFTHAEETKRAIRREERQRKRQEEYKIAKENCPLLSSFIFLLLLTTRPQTNPLTTQKLLVIPTKLSSSPVSYVPLLAPPSHF